MVEKNLRGGQLNKILRYQLLLTSEMIDHIHFFGIKLLLHAFSCFSYKVLKILLIPSLNQAASLSLTHHIPRLGSTYSYIKYNIFAYKTRSL